MTLLTVWLSLIGVISPIWTGFIYMNLTGHGKGYDYDMGSEADIAVAIGVLLVFFWLLAVLPAMILLCRKFFLYRKLFILIPIFGFVFLYCVGIQMIGWGAFLEFFGFGSPFI